FNWEAERVRFLFFSYLPVTVIFAVAIPFGTKAGWSSLLLIPAGILVQSLLLAAMRRISLHSFAMVFTTWMINAIFAYIIRFFFLESGLIGGALVLALILIAMFYEFRSGSRLNRSANRIKTLSLQNKLVSSLYSEDSSLQLFLIDGFHVWTMQGKPAAIIVPEAPSQIYRMEKKGEWHVVSTEKSTFIAQGEAATELRSINMADLKETLNLLENVWRSSFSKRRLENAFLGAASMFVKLADRKDSDTHHHSIRVSQMAAKLAGVLGLSRSEILQLRIGALLHDIGKLAVPGNLVMKKGLLTRSERTVIETHPEAGIKLLGAIQRYGNASSIVLQHHEHIDGTGYPRGIANSSISLFARIVAVADVFDAITSPRAYHPGVSDQSALAEIMQYRGTYFDANVVDALEELLH
ncbi:MAG: HD domain-containing phosphohydrolase, partial [Candidatus Fermentibacteria bacterium]|nr:HD domain-containing phosphohydrolase [Candidatus Fermentibacteria bacterium]